MKILITRAVGLAFVLGLAVGGCHCGEDEEQDCHEPIEQDLILLTGGDRQQVLSQGREAVSLIRQQDAAALHARFSPQLAQEIPEEVLRQTLQQLFATAPLGEPLGEAVWSASSAQGVQTLYQGDYRWSQDEELLLAMGVDAEGRIIALEATPRARLPPDPHAGYRLQARLQLPLAAGDTWYVFWGGPSRVQNHHAEAPDQRHAYDLIMLNTDGRSHTGDGRENEQYLCWGRPITAPADATVIATEGGIQDNCPGVMNPLQPAGNHVLLDFGHGEYGLFAHLQRHSVQVDVGQQVRAGDVLGLCGNSGNSSEPHLHFHLQDGPGLFEALGLPVTFVDYVSNGQPVTEGTPMQGELLRLGQ